MEYGQLLGTLNAWTTVPSKLPFAGVPSGQQHGKEEATCENGKQAIEWTACDKASQESPRVMGQCPGGCTPVCFPFGRGLPQGASANEYKPPEDGRCLAVSKGPFKAAVSPPPTQELPDWLKLLSFLHTLKVWLLADWPDSLGIKEKAFLIVCVRHQHFVACILFVCVCILFYIESKFERILMFPISKKVLCFSVKIIHSFIHPFK